MQKDNEKSQSNDNEKITKKEVVPPPPDTKTRKDKVTYVTKNYRGKLRLNEESGK
ncbi:hypothetical protein FF011L_47130 [Roseimaritima multifibrata]|uniref:Uncharacterized protein n=1 Tax=Roseimaritima multifibrata TaxID=1930274 RepID=A0A517MLZ4_9BACT|nr:hypothetical protein FF011L_47130 [Roseimaritima multifibrata]